MMNIDKGISPENKVVNSKATILFKQPFFGVPVFKLVWKQNDLHVQTACTDGKSIIWSAKFFDTLTKAESTAVIIHEIFHVILNHPLEMKRFFKNNPKFQTPHFMKLANKAMDYSINWQIKLMECEWLKLPQCALLDERFKDMHWIKIFMVLVSEDNKQPDQGKGQPDQDQDQGSDTSDQDQDQGSDTPDQDQDQDQPDFVNSVNKQDQGKDQGSDQDDQGSDTPDQGKDQGSASDDEETNGSDQSNAPTDAPVDEGGMGGVVIPTNDDGSDLTPAQENEMKKELEVMIEQAKNVAKSRGDLPSHLAELAEDSKKARVNWEMVLRRFLAPVKFSGRSFKRLNRKFQTLGINLPSKKKSGVGELAIGIDTSSSTSMEEISQCIAEVQKVCDGIQPEKISIHWFTSRVWQSDTYRAKDRLVIPSKVERGGTSFKSLFDVVNGQATKPKALIVLTDMEDSFPAKPKYPVLWISTQEKKTAPYGTVTYLDAVA